MLLPPLNSPKPAIGHFSTFHYGVTIRTTVYETLTNNTKKLFSKYLSVLKILAISGTRGSSGFGSQRREQTDNRTLLMVRAGDHWDLRMSRQMEPFELIFGW